MASDGLSARLSGRLTVNLFGKVSNTDKRGFSAETESRGIGEGIVSVSGRSARGDPPPLPSNGLRKPLVLG